MFAFVVVLVVDHVHGKVCLPEYAAVVPVGGPDGKVVEIGRVGEELRWVAQIQGAFLVDLARKTHGLICIQ